MHGIIILLTYKVKRIDVQHFSYRIAKVSICGLRSHFFMGPS